MENWRSYREQQLEEGCTGSDCLQEYTVGDFLEDVQKKTGLVEKFYKTMDEFLRSGDLDSDSEKAIKNVVKYVADKGIGVLIAGGLGGLLGLFGGGAASGGVGAVPGAVGGFKAGAVMGAVGSDLVKKGLGMVNTRMEKMFLDAQKKDPPEDARGWILDLNDQVEKLVKGGGKGSPLFQSFMKQLIAVFEGVEERLKAEQAALPRDATGAPEIAAVQSFMNQKLSAGSPPYLKMTASQELQDFINKHHDTTDVVAQHHNIKESK